MNGTRSTDLLEPLNISKEWLTAQQKFLPNTAAYARVAETMRSIAQANTTYMQELMRANAALLAAFMPRLPGEFEERPSDAAHRPDTAVQ